ncbi:MAG TPA: LacI family DNA-binding transcriptional regulator [Chloroflexota bacterium]|nr:LacI family DNA-binding transcriptional regulator [Chloroflexota bacterium]
MSSRSVTRDDVARRAGVSVATVSYVLNAGPKPVSADKRRRVLEAVTQLGYRPNAIARSLRARRTNILGLIVPDSANPYFARLSRSIEDAAAERGYQVVVSNAAEDPEREAAQIEALLRLQVDGLLWVPADLSASHAGAPEGVPTVQVDRALPPSEAEPAGDVIESDNALGGRLAAEHLLELGHRRIAFLSGPAEHLHTIERLRGAREAASEAGVELEVRHGDFGYRSGYEAGRAWFSLPPAERPTAVICANDAMALGALCAAAEAGVRVPADLSVTGYDDIAQARYTVPPLTTVAQPLDEMAREAIDRLLVRVGPKAERPEPVRRVYPVKLVVRNSTARVRE